MADHGTGDQLPCSGGTELTTIDSPAAARRRLRFALRDAREVFEREYLLAQVTRFGGNISRTATFVGMERSALHRKLKSLGLHGSSPDDRNGTEPAA